MLLSNIIIKVTLLVVGFGGTAFADGQVEEAQPNANGEINISDLSGEQKRKAPKLSKPILITKTPKTLKNEAIKALKEAVDYALSSDFQQNILKHDSKDELNTFKETLDNAIAVLSRDEKITMTSDYDKALNNLDDVTRGIIFEFPNN